MCAKPISLMYSSFSGSGSGADLVTWRHARERSREHEDTKGGRDW
jgi:hypothetical protein